MRLLEFLETFGFSSARATTASNSPLIWLAALYDISQEERPVSSGSSSFSIDFPAPEGPAQPPAQEPIVIEEGQDLGQDQDEDLGQDRDKDDGQAAEEPNPRVVGDDGMRLRPQASLKATARLRDRSQRRNKERRSRSRGMR